MNESATDADISTAWTALGGSNADPAVDYSSHSRITWTDRSGLRLFSDAAGPLLPAQSLSRGAGLVLKRMIDIVIATTSIVALLPLLIAVAIGVKATSTGPILVRHARLGRDGKPFMLLKFRTFFVDDRDASGSVRATANNGSVTAFGRFLLRTSIDELPQLMNLLRGEMSVVGPQSHVKGLHAADVDYELLGQHYNSTQTMRPGLTGWAQANGFRGRPLDVATSRLHIDHDVAYAQNFTIWLDLKIIVRTVWREFSAATVSE